VFRNYGFGTRRSVFKSTRPDHPDHPLSYCGRQAVIIVDALETGAPPGTVHRMTLNELRELSLGRARSAHEGNARELLAAAELLGELPDRLFVVGVEPESITTGFGLSSHVQEALSAASDQVSCLLSELC
jgi:hydrogenase maturation protease